jgi:hypothetical protein
MSKSECLLEDWSPNGNVFALVEQDEATCYFYLHDNQRADFGVKSCWVRNLGPAPDTLNVSAMRDGVQPALPARFCRHREGTAPLRSENLSVIWAEEGDAAALRENREILAIIPCWSGRNGFHGYARDCNGESPLCWELGSPDTNAQFERYGRASEFWKSWDQAPGPWPAFRDQLCDAVERHFGKHSNYYAIDGGKWPPKALLRMPQTETTILVTIGMSLRPQPAIELYFENPCPHRRVELAISLHTSVAEEGIKRIASYLSGQSGYPWAFHTFFGNGHTLPADAFAAVSEGAFPFALLQHQPGAECPIDLPPFRGDPVNLLWLTPISRREQKYAEENGSAQLAHKLQLQGAFWGHRFERAEVI